VGVEAVAAIASAQIVPERDTTVPRSRLVSVGLAHSWRALLIRANPGFCCSRLVGSSQLRRVIQDKT